MTEYFQYGEKELTYLKQRDKRLSEIIDKVGWVKRSIGTFHRRAANFNKGS